MPQHSESYLLTLRTLPIFKNYGGCPKTFCLYGLHLSLFNLLKIKIDTFSFTTTSQDCLIGF